MKFATEDGSEVQIDPALKRQLSPSAYAMRLMRCQTWERYRALGFTVKAIAETFNFGLSTVKADLKFLRDERGKRRRSEAG